MIRGCVRTDEWTFDARSFRMPPDRSCLVLMIKDGSLAGMDPLGFWYPPDGLLFGLKMLLRGSREENVPPGMNERCFWGPPDWMEREPRKIMGEVSVSSSENLPGTEILGFQVPPDG